MFDFVIDDLYLKFFGLFYLVVAASLLAAPAAWKAFLARIGEDKALCLLIGLLTLIFSLMILVFYDGGDGGSGSILLYAIGVLGFIKALFYLLIPGRMQKISQTKSLQCWWTRLGGIVGGALGFALLVL